MEYPYGTPGVCFSSLEWGGPFPA